MPDVLIGNFKGPQGETGPANKLLATVYQFCESNDGQKIPDGPWLEEMPEIQKGKYYWCRNIMTWDEGEDSVLYSVGYVGLDGEFTGTDLLEELKKRVDALETRTTPIDKGGTGSTTLDGAQAKLGITQLRTDMQTADKALGERIDGINDYTTGINLLRGTRDFRQGVETLTGGARPDGFGTSYGNVTYEVDSDGFTYAKLQKTTDTAGVYLNASLFNVNLGDTYTISGEIKVASEGVPSNCSVLSIVYLNSGNTLATQLDLGVTQLGIDVSNTKDWQSFKYTIKVDNANCVKAYPRIRIYTPSQTNHSGDVLLFKKLDAQVGKIDHPIYAPSINDVDYINDITTMPNLLRGTRDFVDGVKKFANSNYFTDGFLIKQNAFSKSIDDDGFTVLTSTANNSVDFINAVYDGNISKGDKFTYSFEVRYTEPATFPGNTMAVIYVIDSSGAVKHTENIGFGNIGIRKIDLSNNQWYRFTYHYTVPIGTDTSYALVVCLVNQSGTTANRISFKKPLFIHGHIDNAIWAASPFDVASVQIESDAIAKRDRIIDNTDWGEYTEPGIYYFNGSLASNTTGKPAGSYGFGSLLVGNCQQSKNSGEMYVFQMYLPASSIYDGFIRYGSKTSIAEQSWRRLNTGTIPYEGGGTNANTLAGAKSNLGITALETRVKTLEDQLAALTS